MDAKRINPILNVSDIRASFAWSEALDWEKAQSGMLAGLFDSVLYSLLPALQTAWPNTSSRFTCNS